MPINEHLEGAIKSLADVVGSNQPDVQSLRDALLSGGNGCIEALTQGEARHPWLTEADADIIAFSPIFSDGHPILINGKSTTFWPKADAISAISAFCDAVASGAFDDQLTDTGQPAISPKIEGEQRPDDVENGSMTTGGGRTDASEIETRFTEHLGNRTKPTS